MHLSIPENFPIALNLISLAIGIVSIKLIINAQNKISEIHLKSFIQWVLGGVVFMMLTALNLALNPLINLSENSSSKIHIYFFLYMSLICFSISIMILNKLSETYGFQLATKTKK